MADISKLEQQAMQLDQEIIDKAVESIQKLAEVIVDVWNKVIEVVKNVFGAFCEALGGFMKQVNPKIYHVAYYHKNHRVRNKNKKRLFLLFRRWLNG
jgi:hypothetical protein